MQPLEAKHKVAIALGLAVLGLLIWVSAKTLAPESSPMAAAQSAPQGTGPHLDIIMPDKVVTMLGVPEVILSPSSSSRDDAGPGEDKPSKPARDTELKPASAPPVKPTRSSARRSDDTFLVKPE